MKVLAFSSQKGGSGKTTLAGHVAVQAERAGGGPVALIDTDPQGSLADWWNERGASAPRFIQSSLDRLSHDVGRARDAGIKLLVIDTPPAITETIEQVVRVSDLIAVPVRPSPHDLRAVGPTIELIEDLGKPFVFVLNSVKPRARIASEAAFVLSQHGTVAPVAIHNRTDYAASMIDGRTVMEIQRGERSAEEIEQLWRYLDQRLNSGSRKVRMSPDFTRLGGRSAETQATAGVS